MPVTQLIRAWESARRVTFDAGIARGPWGERYFIEGVGVGLLTTAIPKASKSKTLEQLTETDAKVSYAQQIFHEHLADAPAMDVEVKVDGEDISGRFLLLEVLNIQYIGPNLFLAPDLVRNDGEFDVVMCVLATAQDAHMRKFKLRVPANCVAGFNRAQEVSALATIKRTLSADIAQYRSR